MSESIVDVVFSASETIKDGRDNYRVLAFMTSEVGELADEVTIAAGHTYKVQGVDGILGESVDVMINALDMIHLNYPDVSEETILEIVKLKCAKWYSKRMP